MGGVSSRKLFLAFDHCHILKNLRNQLLSSKRVNDNGKELLQPPVPEDARRHPGKASSFQACAKFDEETCFQQLLKR